MNPFRLYGNKIQVYHWKAEYTENGETVTKYFPSKREAEATGGTVSQIDSSEYDWLDEIEIPDSKDPYAEAMKIYKEGKNFYQEKENFGTNLEKADKVKISNSVEEDTKSKLNRFKADLDYLAALQDVIL